MNPSLWLYSIHGNNPEMIHFLEENKVIPKDKSYEECLKESIKCHHNEIAIYIQDNLIINYKEIPKRCFTQSFISYSFEYYNYYFIPEENDDFNYIFYCACYYNYPLIVDLLLKTQKIDLNQKIIFNFILFIKFQELQLQKYIFF